MTYVEKEDAILAKLEETGYAMFDGDKDDALGFIEGRFGNFVDYANAVIRQQYMQPILYAKYEGQDLRDRVEELDRRRKSCHDCAIDGINMLNRFSKALGLEPFSDVDTSDRHAVADFVGDYVGELYGTGAKGMDAATIGKGKEYDRTVSDARVRAAEAVAPAEAEAGTPGEGAEYGD